MPKWLDPWREAATIAVAAVVALLALAYLHGEVELGPAVICGGVAASAAVALSATWAHLPSFVRVWLHGGLATTVGLLGALATITTRDVPYVLLRWEQVAGLAAAVGLAGTATASLGYTHARLAREVAAQGERLAALQRRALESRLSALSAQINPHFLFNTLNTLAEVVHEDEDRAEDLVTDLAGMMRHALNGSTSRVPLGEELDVIRRLLRLESARLRERLRWTVEADPEVLDALIPALLVQPLVENAVRHGVAPRAEGGTVEVVAKADGDRVRVTISDDGGGLPEDVAAEVAAGHGAPGGLLNSAERVRLAWGEGQGRLVQEPGPGTRLVLEFPREVA